jgi:Big-like domain-containing protein
VATSVTLGSSSNPSTYAQPVTFTATVIPASGSAILTGSVTFKDGGTTLGSSVLNSAGVAFLTLNALAVGSHSITALYSGDFNFAGSTSAALSQAVNSAVTTTAVSSSLNPSVYAQNVTFSAAVSPAIATGTVQFQDGVTALGSAAISGGKASFSTSSLVVGSHSITAAYAGDSNFGASTSTTLSQVVNKGNTTTALTSSENPSVVGQALTFTATISNAAATGTVTFIDGSQMLGTATVLSGKASLSTAALTVGRHSITAKYNGDGNFNGSTSAAVSQNVKRK